MYDIARVQAWKRRRRYGRVKRMVEYYETLDEWEGCLCCERTTHAPKVPAFIHDGGFHYIRAGPHITMYLQQYLMCTESNCWHRRECYPLLSNRPNGEIEGTIYIYGAYIPYGEVIDYVYY